MSNSYKASYAVVIGLIFLIPIFFIPVLSVPPELSKMILITLGALAALALLIIEAFRSDRISFPSHYVLWGALALPAAYFISGAMSALPWRSLTGYSFEAGTTASILLFSVIFAVTAVVFRDRSRLLAGYSALLLSLAVLSVFAIVKIVSGGEWLAMRNFFGNMANPVGAWTDYAVTFGLLSIAALFVIEMLPLRGGIRFFSYALFAVSLALLAVINFASVWWILLVVSVVLLVYFLTVEKRAEGSRAGSVAAGVMLLFSLVFIFNPVISPTRGSVSSTVSSLLGINNTDIRPSYGTTLAVAKSALRESPVLGLGPNSFSDAWMRFKPESVNSTAFWRVAFPFGAGFVPTQIASTGAIGAAAWGAFFILLAVLGLRAFTKSPESRADRFILMSSLFITLYLWTAAFLYTPSMAVLALTFIFTGLFAAAAAATGVIGERELIFSRNVRTHFVSILVLLALAAGTLAFAFVAYQKAAATVHFERAIALSSTEGSSLEDVELELAKAVNLSPTDALWGALSELEIGRANLLLNNATGTDEENVRNFQNSLGRAIAYRQNAITMNPSYRNWVALGNIYASLVPAPLRIEGAKESAETAYARALETNPFSPEIPLLLARLALAEGDIEAARTRINESLAKKQDYADAYFLLAELEAGQDNLAEAITSAETGVLLTPNNAGVLLQLGLLRYSNEDYAGAAEAFRAALSLLPDYANAKYYLGLSLAELGREGEAIAQFEDLALTNPDNELVRQVLANLKAGKDALAGVGSGSSATPPIRE